MRTIIRALLATLVVVLTFAAVAGQSVRAGQDITVSGTWRIRLQSDLTCIAALEQDGSDFSGQADCDIIRTVWFEGQIDLTTGAFTARSGLVNLDGTLAPDGNSMAGTWTGPAQVAGTFTGDRADDLERIDLSGDWTLFMHGHASDTCALSIHQSSTSATASMDCQSVGSLSSSAVSVGQFSGRIYLSGTLRDIYTAFEGVLSTSGEYIAGSWSRMDRRDDTGTFIAVHEDQLARGILAVDCEAGEPGLQSMCWQDGARLNFDVQLVVVAPPAGGFTGFNASLDWEGAVLRFIHADETPPPSCTPLLRPAVILPIPPVLFGCELSPGTSPSSFAGPIALVQLRCDAAGNASLTLGPDTMFFEEGVVEPVLVDANVQCYARVHDGPSVVRGDVTCDDTVNSTDAAVILQYEARLLEQFPCTGDFDLNGDGRTNSVDASIILQYAAGLILSIGHA